MYEPAKARCSTGSRASSALAFCISSPPKTGTGAVAGCTHQSRGGCESSISLGQSAPVAARPYLVPVADVAEGAGSGKEH
ncbi:hypothetical protein E5D57_003107 [Metarhizium anisopliae]|nr:hypothetical protein E5D57_003107 [Metarhizium anisopliae]